MNHFKVKFALFVWVVCSFGLVDKMLFVPPVFSLLTRKQLEYRQYYQRQGSQVVVLLIHVRGCRNHEIAKKWILWINMTQNKNIVCTNPLSRRINR